MIVVVVGGAVSSCCSLIQLHVDFAVADSRLGFICCWFLFDSIISCCMSPGMNLELGAPLRVVCFLLAAKGTGALQCTSF